MNESSNVEEINDTSVIVVSSKRYVKGGQYVECERCVRYFCYSCIKRERDVESERVRSEKYVEGGEYVEC